MPGVADLLADVLSYSPTEKGENSPFRPTIRPCENGLDTASSHDSPISPAVNLKSISPTSTAENNLEKIRTWLFEIGEPESDHFLVLERCRGDAEALAYYLKHAAGEFEYSYSATDELRADDRVKCSDCLFLFGGHCQKFKITNGGIRYQPVKGILKRCREFKLKAK